MKSYRAAVSSKKSSAVPSVNAQSSSHSSQTDESFILSYTVSFMATLRRNAMCIVCRTIHTFIDIFQS
jgi:hypothetical protein